MDQPQHKPDQSPVSQDFVLSSDPSWTGVIFFAALSLLHFAVWIPAFAHARWEGYLSVFFAAVFASLAIIMYRARFELAILPGARAIRLRHGLRRFHFQRLIPFGDVHGVRLTVSHPGGHKGKSEARIELLCDSEDLECPATRIPRQQALFLAMIMGVRLITASDQETPDEPVTDVALAGRI